MASASHHPLSRHGAARWCAGLLAAAALFAVHGWFTLRLFGDTPAAALLSDEPIVQGRHALRLQQAQVGAAARRFGSETAFDPTFQAGYPKTPWFDAESPAAELFLLAGSAENSPQAYKIGLALLWWSIPLCMGASAWLLAPSLGTLCLALLLSLMVSWSEVGRERLFAGDVTTIAASLLTVAWCAALLRLASEPSPGAWLCGTAALASLLWLQPLAAFLVTPIGLAYFLRAGWRQSFSWQAWFLCGFATAGTLTLWRFQALLSTSWLLTEAHPAAGAAAPSFAIDWLGKLTEANLGQMCFIALVFGMGAIGLAVRRLEAPPGALRAWAALMSAAALVAWFGPVWPLLERFDPARLLFTGVLLAVPPAAYALRQTGRLAQGLRALSLPQACLAVLPPLALVALVLAAAGQSLHAQFSAFRPLHLGLPAEAKATAEAIRAHTAPSARVLWEESLSTATWSPFLPQLVDRAFLGGLGASSGLDCFWLRLNEGQLAGKPLSDWRPEAWQDLCRRANVGWVVVRTAATRVGIQQLGGVSSETRLPDGSTLLTLGRPHSFFLKGQGRLELKDGRVTLLDVVPEGGEAVVSLHHLHGLRATLSRVALEGVPQSDDPLPLLRLKTVGPLARVTLFGP